MSGKINKGTECLSLSILLILFHFSYLPILIFYFYNEYAVADSRQGVAPHLGFWARC